MIGTISNRNVFHRLGDAWNAFKAAPPIQPAQLYTTQSSAQTFPLIFQGWDREDQRAGDQDRANARLAVTSPWVFADIQAIAHEISTAELVVKERKGIKLEDVDNHPLERLWESPNEFMGRSLVIETWAWFYILFGKAYLYWVPDTSGSMDAGEVYPVPPWMLKPMPDAEKFIKGYLFKSSASAPAQLIPPEYITYSHSVNPFDMHDGLSFLASALTEIRGDLAASKWNLNFFDDNNGIPDGLLSVNKDTLDADLQRVRQEIRDFYGGPKRGVAVARSGDIDYKPFGRNQKDMEFTQGREFASKVIGRVLGFPDGYWSDLANRANAEQARATMIAGAVWPLLVRLAEDMNAARRGVVQFWYGDTFRVEFKDIRIEDRQIKIQEYTAASGVLLINELRERFWGEKPLEDVRGTMLLAEITKGAPTPGSEPAQELEDAQAAKDEAAAQEQAAAIEAGQAPAPVEQPPPPEAGAPLEGEAPPPEVAPAEGAIVPMKAIDMERWERKAIKSLRRFKRADVAFESNAIPLGEQVRIHDALQAADNVEAIKAAFRRDATDRLLDDVDADARAWVDEVTQ